MKKKKKQLLACKICGKKFSTLATHIIRTHKITTDNYLKRFPESPLTTKQYRHKISLTTKSRFLEDPELRKRVASRTFDFVRNSKLRSLLSRDYKTAQSYLENALWKPSIILYGSLIEAILRENTGAKTFKSALDKALKTKVITETEFHQIHVVRDSRNFVHLHKELDILGKTIINDYWAKTLSDICESLIIRFRNTK